MKNKISTLAIAALFSLATVSANASPNYCIIGDNSTDCSLNSVDLTSITTGIVNTGDILGDGIGWWAGIFHSGELPNANPIMIYIPTELKMTIEKSISNHQKVKNILEELSHVNRELLIRKKLS